MNINKAFPSNYLKSDDLDGEVVKAVINLVTEEEVGDDTKPVVHFGRMSKQNLTPKMILNKTNANTIADSLGPETDNWSGKVVEIFSQKVDYQGRRVDGLRVRVAAQNNAAKDHQAPPQPPPTQDYQDKMVDDEIPF